MATIQVAGDDPKSRVQIPLKIFDKTLRPRALGGPLMEIEDQRIRQVRSALSSCGQQHVLRYLEEISSDEAQALLEQIEGLDLAELRRLQAKIAGTTPTARSDSLRPAPALERPRPGDQQAQASFDSARIRGQRLIAEGRVAAFTVAGGQGSRLGWEAPKGTCPVAPITRKSLFQLFAEQLLAIQNRYGREIPWILMTSPENDAATREFFEKHDNFGLTRVETVIQGQLPVLDQTGKLLLRSRSEIAMGPDGHGGALRALDRSGALQRLAESGVDRLFYFQVDNPLCYVLDPIFLGLHDELGAEAASKVIPKVDPYEKVGVLAYRNDRLEVLEYSELSEDLRHQRDSDGRLSYRAGSIANHLFMLEFLQRVASSEALPLHLAHKAVPTIDARGHPLKPEKPNAYKFERFIFDLLIEAKGHLALEVDPKEEFEPLKNASGPNSPQTVELALLERAASWLSELGIVIARDAKGELLQRVEIRASTALDASELRDRRGTISWDASALEQVL